ncbi:MAG: glycosyltransferase [Pirellulales bacterium]|nr:glycosyltransferase [Pirellulales bacterium]
MKILHYLDNFDFNRGGVVQYVFQVTSALAANGVDVTLVVGRNKDLPKEWLSNDTPNLPRVHVLSSTPGIQSWLSNSQLGEIWEVAKSHDVVHLHGVWTLGNARLGYRLSKKNIPYIVSAHGMLDDWSLTQNAFQKAMFNRLINRRFLSRAAMVHCTAEFEMQQIERNFNGFKNMTCVVPFVIPSDSASIDKEMVYQAFPEIDKDKKKLLFLSRLHKKKGPEYLLDAAAELKRKGLIVQVLMTGPGEENYINALKRQADELGVAEQVLWLGMVRDPLKTALYLESDIFVLPSHQENFGIVLVEAMFAGLPIITTCGTDIYLELERGGAVICERSGVRIAEAAQRLLSDPEDLETRSKQGVAFVNDWLDETKTVENYLAMYRNATLQD